MLGRTANDLYWLSRYIERAENIARLLEVGYRIVLLPREGEGFHEEWRSTLESAGCMQGYMLRHGDLVSRKVIDYMLFDTSKSVEHRGVSRKRPSQRTRAENVANA